MERLTKKELEHENHELRKKNLELRGLYQKALDRKKVAGMYLQCMRLLPGYVSRNNSSPFLTDTDYNRILDILEMDDYPECL